MVSPQLLQFAEAEALARPNPALARQVGVGVNELRRPSAKGTGRWAPGSSENPCMPWVYLLLCADGSLYCGWTIDVQRRLAAHRKGTASRYTRSRRPIELAAIISVADRSAALREEARIKGLPRSAKLRLTNRRVDPG